jgi:cell division protease FtsH
MSDTLGPMVYAENEGEVFLGRSITKTTNMSEETMRKVDSEIRRIIDEQYAVARKIIEENRDKIEAMAKALLEWETIDAEQIEDIIAGRPPRPPKERAAHGPPVARRSRPASALIAAGPGARATIAQPSPAGPCPRVRAR